MDYTVLTPELQAQQLRERIFQLEREHFSHEINKTLSVSTIDVTPEVDREQVQAQINQVVEAADAAQAVIEAAHAAAVTALEAIESD